MGFKEAHVRPEFIVAGVLTVWDQVHRTRTLAPYREQGLLHLVHPARWHDAHDLDACEIYSGTRGLYESCMPRRRGTWERRDQGDT